MNPKAAKILTFSRSLCFLFLVIGSVQCSKYDGETEQYVINSESAGSLVVPVTASGASGEMVATYNSNKNKLTGVISWAGLSGAPTAIHFHGPAKAGRNNIQQFTLAKVPAMATGNVTFESVFTESQEGSMINQMFYYDIHTAAYPNGEIRGQIILQ